MSIRGGALRRWGDGPADTATLITAGLLAAGGLLSAFTISNRDRTRGARAAEQPAEAAPTSSAPAADREPEPIAGRS